MKSASCFLFLLLFLFQSALSQVASDYAVLLTATVSENPASITLHWPAYPAATGYSVYRKAKNSNNWGASIATPDGTATEFNDADVVADSGYEYKVRRTSTIATAEGYIYAAIKLHATDYRGKCLLLIDTTITSTMENELHRLMKDISGDGWVVKRINVSRNDSVPYVKALIRNEYLSDPDTRSVVLFGHVPVPYSGAINPDGHPDHYGAWPFDGFYADMDGEYTDYDVDVTTASRQENWNVPGDGKFDQSYFESDLTLQVGRVDLFNLPSFAEDEATLLKNYLDKDHDFRTGNFTASSRALIDDNFGAFGGEAFASVGWRSFSPLVGDTGVHELDYFSSMQAQNYLWSYGCGGGWYQGASGVGSTTDFVNDTVQTVFTCLFGSYFGDWDASDDFLRAPLASKNRALTCCWAGRPYWHFHHMALGENIGFSALKSQNNCTTYLANICCGWVHIALMGDPTLRMHVIRPVSNLQLSVLGENEPVEIAWNAPDDDVLGYYVYRSTNEFGTFDRMSDTLVTGTSFTDWNPQNGTHWYMVRAVRLEETPSGSYYNMSEGVSDSISAIVTGIAALDGKHELSVYPNPATNLVMIRCTGFNDGKVYVLDAAGRHLMEVNMNGNDQTIGLTSLPQGIYFIQTGTVIKKLVKQ
jgi:hypothetical protein